jgi:glycosyltransferase involved in cell wall biosynthesis
MTKILHIITRLDMGGSAQNTLTSCSELSHKYRMILAHGLSLESRMTDSEKMLVAGRIKQAKERGVKFIALSSLVRRIAPLQDLKTLVLLWQIIKREKPDVVHTHTSKAGILGRVAARLANAPHIVHTPHGHVFFGHFNRVASSMFLCIERFFARFTDRLVALTEGEKKDYIDLAVGDPGNLAKIHSGVDIVKYSTPRDNTVERKRSLGLSQNGGVIGFVGWLLPIKGPMYLLRAMETVWRVRPDASLIFVGKGDMDMDLRTESLRIGANGNVKFLGWREDIDELIPIFDILALPSLNEGMGRVLVEAMAAGKPVVASRVGGVPDLVKHGESGMLVPPANKDALAEAILHLLDNPEKARQMGQRGRERCRPFSVEAMIAKLDALYEGLLGDSVSEI